MLDKKVKVNSATVEEIRKEMQKIVRQNIEHNTVTPEIRRKAKTI